MPDEMPDRDFYNITQQSDGAWLSTPKALDDTTENRQGFTLIVPGIRTMLKGKVNIEVAKRIEVFAPAWVQNNALYTIQTLTGQSLNPDQQTDLDAANTLFQDINALRTYGQLLKTEIDALNFGEAVSWTISTEWPVTTSPAVQP